MNATRVSVAVLLSLAASLAGPARAASPLATPDQREVEAQAVALLSAPELARARDAALKRFEAAPNGAGSQGRAARRAADELAYAAALAAVNGDPGRPRVTWAFTAPRR